MPEEFSINISDFSGIFRTMAEKANLNGDNKLDESEISIFCEINKTYNIKNNTFMFGNKFYNEQGNSIEPMALLAQKSVSTRVYRPEIYNNNVSKNYKAVEKAKKFAQEQAKNRNKTIVVKKTINGKEVNFSYNRASIEDYIINEAVDSKGNKLKLFANIPKIRKKPFGLRTKEEIEKLNEFNNMVSCAINAGTEYGVDPKLIVSIMQREVGFDGLNKNVVGVNGKGYMQITSIVIKDMLGAYSKKDKLVYGKKIKTDVYGPEMEDLLKSRGFNINCTPDKRKKVVAEIMDYLVKNTDADFNIRLGALVLRRYLDKCDGDVKLTAQNYNGNSKNNIKYKYGVAVKNFYDKLCSNENQFRA